MNSDRPYEEFLPVGIVQTTVNAELAWRQKTTPPRMSDSQDAHAWHEICKSLRAFKDGDEQPRFVILPELSLPRTRLSDFEELICALNVIVIAGVDYRLEISTRSARNEGVVFVPSGFWSGKRSRRCARIQFGKCHPAPLEKRCLEALNPPWSFAGDDKVYVFDAERFGRIGVSICYDFMDLERAVMYRGQVQHLIVLAYNRDLGMFKSLADSLSRTVYCNVVVCNTGHYGGSVAVAPYYEAFQRTIYAHGGSNLFTTQVINLPVKGLIDASSGKSSKPFKDPPPGFRQRGLLPSTQAQVESPTLIQVPLVASNEVRVPCVEPVAQNRTGATRRIPHGEEDVNSGARLRE